MRRAGSFHGGVSGRSQVSEGISCEEGALVLDTWVVESLTLILRLPKGRSYWG